MSVSAKVLVFQGTPAVAELKLARRGLIEGRVSETPGAVGIPGTTVRLWTANWKLVGALSTGADGSYRFEGVDAGPHIVTVDVPTGFIADVSALHVPSTDQVTGHTDFVLRRSGSLSGRVVDLTMNPLAGVVVAAYDGTGRRVAESRTGPTGDYAFEGLPGRAFTVRVGA